LTNAVAIGAGAWSSQALKSDGTVVAWGRNESGVTNVPAGLTNVLALGAGDWHSLALVPAARLIVASSFGTPSPGVGTNWVIRNAPKKCTANAIAASGATQYVCGGWIGSGSITVSGTSTQVTSFITNDSCITWLWQTNYWLNILATTNGSVSPTSGWFAVGSNLQVQATSATYYHFNTWSGTVATAANPFSTNVTGPFGETAYFAENLTTNTGTPHWWLAQYGLSTNDAGALYEDGDGMPAWKEYIAGTDPTNKLSVLQVTNLVFVSSNVCVGWRGGQQAWQFLERATNLLGTGVTWTILWSNPPPNATATNFTDSAVTNTIRFYRVRSHR
jgi:hypothetical protein